MKLVAPPDHIWPVSPTIEWRYMVARFQKDLARENLARAKRGDKLLERRDVKDYWDAFERQRPERREAFLDWSREADWGKTEADKRWGRVYPAPRVNEKEAREANITGRPFRARDEPPKAPKGKTEKWIYVIAENEELWIARDDGLGHPAIIHDELGNPIPEGRYGGEAIFDDRGRIVELNNKSSRFGVFEDRRQNKLRRVAEKWEGYGVPVKRAVWYDVPGKRWSEGEVVFRSQKWND